MDQRLSLITLGVRDASGARAHRRPVERGKLATDSGVTDTGGWGGVRPSRRGHVLGGYSGVFIDPDGHPWEVAHNPSWTVHEDGRTTLD
jgi:uncharacterized protein